MEFFILGLLEELQQAMSSTPLIEHITESLDTGPTDNDAYNSKPIDPELDDSEQLTAESYLYLEGQLHWLVTLGRLIIHGQPCRILGLTTFNSLLQKVNWLVWEVCSVNNCQSEQGSLVTGI